MEGMINHNTRRKKNVMVPRLTASPELRNLCVRNIATSYLQNISGMSSEPQKKLKWIKKQAETINKDSSKTNVEFSFFSVLFFPLK